MDEPFGAIDPINRGILQEGFLALQAQVRKTVVFVTHDIDEAIKLGDRIAILREAACWRSTRHPPRSSTARPTTSWPSSSAPTAHSAPWPRDARRRRAGGGQRSPARGGDPVSTNVRDALSVVLAAGGEPFTVIGDDGEVLGLATLEAIAVC